MDLAFTKEEVAFREEVRQFFKDNVPPETRRKLVEGRHLSKDEMVTWWRILNKKGWAVPHWPVEWGGTGWSSVKQYIFREEMQQTPAPEPLPFGVNMVGLSGQMLPEEPRAPLAGGLPESYLQAVPSSIYSGSNEIQRNVIATRGLGLPRG